MKKLLLAPLALFLAHSEAWADWPSWRGPNQTGSAPAEANPPIKWSPTEGIAWKTAIPGQGHSSPVVAGDHLFLTAAVPVGDPLEPKYSGRPGAHNNLPVTSAYEFTVLAVNRKTGEIIWQKVVRTAVPHEGGHESGSLASASPVTDGKTVYASFGSLGLYALDLKGNLLWERDLGDMHSKHGHGEGTSPVLHGESLIVNWDHEEQSFMTALDTKTGTPRWKIERDEPSSWATPIVIKATGYTQVVVNGTNRIRSHDIETGDLLWHVDGLSANVVASPVFHSESGILVAGSSYDTRRMVALQVEGAVGDLDGTANVLWEKDSRTPYVPSLLLHEKAVYYLTHYQGVLSKADLKTGEIVGGPWRLFGMREIYASPVAVAGRIYITDRTGSTVILRSEIAEGEEANLVIGKNQIGEPVNASLAISGPDLFLRGTKHLFCLRQE